MNRFLSALLLLFLVVALSACDNSTSNLEEEGGTTTLAEETSSPRDDDLAYQDIESRQTKGDQQVLLSLRDTSFSLELPLPAEWEIAEEEGELSLLRDGLPIGAVTTKSVNGPWRTVSTMEREANGIRIDLYIERCLTADAPNFRYRIVFSPLTGDDTARSITLLMRYEEIGDRAIYRLLTRSKQSAGLGFGILPQAKGGNILILGNSFIGTSEIGNTLTTMLRQNDKGGTVTALSRGYATTSTYAYDNALLSRIRSGLYDVVFLCGFYDISEIGLIENILNACNRGGAALAFFPAHNESPSHVLAALDLYPALPIIDWCGELNALISLKGVSRSLFCIDDAHQHSTPLAGYVGAHMIYRAIYGEVPDGFFAGIRLAPLGSYVEDGFCGKAAYTVG